MSKPTDTKRTLEEVLEAVERGYTAKGAAQILGVSRKTMTKYMTRWKAVHDAVFYKREEMVDLAEIALRAAIVRGEAYAVTWTLGTLGKSRGYTQRHEVTGKDGDALELRVVEKIVTRRDTDD